MKDEPKTWGEGWPVPPNKEAQKDPNLVGWCKLFTSNSTGKVFHCFYCRHHPYYVDETWEEIRAGDEVTQIPEGKNWKDTPANCWQCKLPLHGV